MDAQCCDLLDGRAAAIYAACSLDTLNRQRTRKVIHVQRYLEARIQAMMALWGAQGSPDKPMRSDNLVRQDATAVAAHDAPAPQPGTLAIAQPEEPLIGPAPDAEPQRADAIPAQQAAAPEIDPDWAIADLRALAADMNAQYGNDAAPADNAQPEPAEAVPPPAEPLPPAAPEEPAMTAETLVDAEPAPIADVKPPPHIALEATAAAPQLAAMPRRPAPEMPRRGSDLAEELFADVMALSGDERTALFS